MLGFLKDNDPFLIDKEQAFNYRERRQPDWTETYMLYRDKVMYNRLTQRQSVNVPLMKSSIKTLLKDVDDPPMLYFSNLDNNAQKEVFYNEYWKYCAKENKLVVKDIVDKRQVMLFGRSFKKLNIINGRFAFSIEDPQDILVDRYVDPTRLDSARFLIHNHIYVPLSSLYNNDFYERAQLDRLKKYYSSREGLIKSENNIESIEERNERLEAMGVMDVNDPVLGETYVELSECYKYEWDPHYQMDRVMFSVYADDIIRVGGAVEQSSFIGDTKDDYWEDHYIFTTWADDVEKTDFWSDGVGDSLRTPNKIVNSMISQKVENRTLRSFGMQYYDASNPEFQPQTFEPTPFGWYPIAVPAGKKISDVIQRVDVPDLSDSQNDITFIMDLAARASAATAASQGEIEKSQVTLGEVQLALANAKDRVKSMAPLYTDAWEETGLKFIKLMEAQRDNIDEVEISKQGRNGKRMYTRTIAPKDWESPKGYRCEVRDLTQSKDSDTESIQKLNALKQLMPMNPVVDQVFKRKAAEFAGLNATEVKEVMEAEKQAMIQMAMGGMAPGGQPTPAQVVPGQAPQLPQPGLPAGR